LREIGLREANPKLHKVGKRQIEGGMYVPSQK
jgi:hypothetical protein